MNAERGLNGQKVGVGVGKTMLRNVQTFDLFFHACPQTDGPVDQLEQRDHAQNRISTDREHAETLHAELAESASVKKSF